MIGVQRLKVAKYNEEINLLFLLLSQIMLIALLKETSLKRIITVPQALDENF
jgi:hypothetical protein